MSRLLNVVLPLVLGTTLLLGGCPDPVFPDDDLITVRVLNNTSYDIDPAIEYGDSPSLLVPLDLGLIEPGEYVEADFYCDELWVLTSTGATQFGPQADYLLDPLPVFQLDWDYFCGELVLFEFVGDQLAFDVFVDAGGENIFPAADLITVRVFNNTPYDIDPAVEYGDSPSVLFALNVGIIEPGEYVDVDIACDDLAVLTTTGSTQFGPQADYVLDPLPYLELDRDYFCGELVLFEFIASGVDFDVYVDAGGENIY